MPDDPPIVVNIDSLEPIERLLGERWGGQYKPLTPSMRLRGGSLGINLMTIPPGRTACPFHRHQREDEAFFVLEGRGVLRYGNEIIPLRAGDCVSCPAGTGVAHQLANPYDEGDLVYLAIGVHDRDEVCVYPDSGKVLVRSLEALGRLEKADYFEGEPRPPKIFELATGEAEAGGGGEPIFGFTEDEVEADVVVQRIWELSAGNAKKDAGEERSSEPARGEADADAGGEWPPEE
jgi:uncharacterized cupin superfamily protein